MKNINTLNDIEAFLAGKNLALAGASRNGKKFGNTVLRELRARGHEVLPVHPDACEIEGLACRRSLKELAGKTDSLLLVVPPARTEELVRQAAEFGITKVWMQQGAQSPEAVKFCREHGISVIAGECILMYLDPAAWPHRLHRRLRSLFGRMPRRVVSTVVWWSPL